MKPKHRTKNLKKKLILEEIFPEEIVKGIRKSIKQKGIVMTSEEFRKWAKDEYNIDLK
ncbi:MAG: hypothetical protein LBJ64_08575 [Deltaproteobacteria bacterium]|jgi:hypothetical protein|nr:hypothetical protein [Deltaproteobacteria bacterium]